MDIEGKKLWEKEILSCKKIESNKIKHIQSIVINKNQHNLEQYYDKPNIHFSNLTKSNNKTTTCIDYNSEKKLKIGKYKINKKIDFHGLTIEEAFELFLKSIDFAYSNNIRCLLFITGKGNNSKDKTETIKEHFKKWININYICDKILKCVQATNKDGGSGAFYILLRKSKSY